MKRYILVMSLYGLAFLSLASAYGNPKNNETALSTPATELPWAVMGYWGRMTNETIGSVIVFNYTLNPETLYSLEFTHVLPPQNAFRRFFQPVATTVEVNANFTYRDDPAGPIYEFNPYFSLRWANFPWDKYIATTIAVGEGLSYDSQVPSVELKNNPNDANKLLNFLMLEATFAVPQYANIEFVLRAHHRSGVYGLYNSENTGSTAVGLGVRYRF